MVSKIQAMLKNPNKYEYGGSKSPSKELSNLKKYAPMNEILSINKSPNRRI